MEQEILPRLNELAKIATQRALTPEEETESAALRKQYLATFRLAVQQQLDNTYIQYDDGTKVKLRRKEQ